MTLSGLFSAQLEPHCSLQVGTNDNVLYGRPSPRHTLNIDQIVTTIPKVLTFLHGTLLKSDIHDWSYVTILDDVYYWFAQHWKIITPVTGAFFLSFIMACCAFNGLSRKPTTTRRQFPRRRNRADSKERQRTHFLVKTNLSK
jgi:hypothetical protein